MTRLTVRTLATLGAGLLCAAAGSAIAQDSAAPQTYRARDEQAAWIADPRMREFYQATVDAFANGPDRIDMAAYEMRCREIFTRFAQANNMPVDGILDHLKAIPGQMIENAKRDPAVLASYEGFVEALMGPQSFPADAERVGGEH